MPLMILGLVFVVGMFIFYLYSTSGRAGDYDAEEQTGSGKRPRPREKTVKPDDNLRKEDNVIYLSDDIDRIKRNHNIGSDD